MRVNGSFSATPGILLVGPYDPLCEEYTSLAPPLGVWRLAGVLESAGIRAAVFDPNCCDGSPVAALDHILRHGGWSAIGFSTTGMTLRYDLELASLARRVVPGALIIAGGHEATLKPEMMFHLGPFDLVVMGEGEKPLLEIARRLRCGEPLAAIEGTASRAPGGGIQRHARQALTREELYHAVLHIHYERVPYAAYWRRLERNCRVRDLPFKADREARLAEIRSVRLSTGGASGAMRLDASECLGMVKHIVAAHPDVRTIVFDDDNFVFAGDDRTIPLCESIIAAKARGRIPRELRFVATSRNAALDDENVSAMRRAGFRVKRFGIEDFLQGVLGERIDEPVETFVEPVLQRASA